MSSRAVDIGTLELEELAKLGEYKEMYEAEDQDPMYIFGFCIQRKSTWHVRHIRKMVSSGGSGDYRFSLGSGLKMKNTKIIYSYMIQSLPNVQVKQQFRQNVRIRWGKHLPQKMVVRGTLEGGGINYGEFDSIYLGIYSSYSGIPHHCQKRMSGDVPILTEWSDYLQEYDVVILLPWYYSYNTAFCYDPYYLSNEGSLDHNVTMMTDIKNLLEVQIRDDEDGEWRNLEKDLWNDHLDGIKEGLDPPSMFARCVCFGSPDFYARAFNKTKRTMWIKDVVSIDETNHTNQKSHRLNIDCRYPCLAIFWVAENEASTARGDPFNYTTTIERQGLDPILTNTLSYGMSTKLENLSSKHFQDIEGMMHFKSVPHDEGYHVYCSGSEPFGFDCDTSIIMCGGNSFLSCDLRQGCYKLRARLLVVKKYTVISDKGTFIHNIS